MTESARRPFEDDSLHPATRLARVLQQIQSFSSMHAAELEGVARELDASGQTDLAARLWMFLGLHAQETGLILDELADVRADMVRPAAADAVTSPDRATPPALMDAGAPADRGANTAWRARWLAGQSEHAHTVTEQVQQPRSRREFFQRPQL